MTFGVAIIGAGMIGRKRVMALEKDLHSKIVAIVDVDKERAEKLAGEFGGEVLSDWQDAVKRDDVDIVIVATFNKFLALIGTAALKNKKHVLCEKPLGRNTAESKEMIDMAARSGRVLKTGFNHRCHPGIAHAKQLMDDGEIGVLHFLRCRYGHGGRPGYEKEWRADREMCGGGELLDQGVHVVDLFRWFAGDFDEVFGHISTLFWDIDVEDNAFAVFKKKEGVGASMHTSWTQWKNLFSFEIFGSKGYLLIEGLGGSYGVETLKIGKCRPEGGVPDERMIEFPGPDISWEEEWKEFISAIGDDREPVGNGWDGYHANRMIEAVYESGRTGKVVSLAG